MPKPQSNWKSWEKRIASELPLQGLLCWQIPTTVRFLPGGRTIAVKSYPDFTVAHGPFAIYFDAKSTAESTWNIRDNVLRMDKSSNKLHQWTRLEDAYDRGAIAGYLIWFVELRSIVWASVPTIRQLIASGVKSINPGSPSVLVQPDHVPIDFKSLIEPDVRKIPERHG